MLVYAKLYIGDKIIPTAQKKEKILMSVLKKNRRESTVQFIATAYEICQRVKTKQKKMSKNARFYIGNQLRTLAEEAIQNLLLANEIRPTDTELRSERKLLLKSAITKYKQLSKLIDMSILNPTLCDTVVPRSTIPFRQWEYLIRLIDKELSLITGLLRYDQNTWAGKTN